jgi:hypothetical protein
MMPKDEQEIVVTIGLKEWTRQCIEQALSEHSRKCPIAERVQKIEMSRAVLIGFMIGSGLFGGTAGAAVMKIILGA